MVRKNHRPFWTSSNNIIMSLNRLQPVPAAIEFSQQETPENRVLLAQYDAKQIYYSAVSNRGEKFDPAIQPTLNMYNEYFGGGMTRSYFRKCVNRVGWLILRSFPYYSVQTEISVCIPYVHCDSE